MGYRYRPSVSAITRSTLFRIMHLGKEKFECPICGYIGPFADLNPSTGLRRHAKCVRCGALERHRLQYLAIRKAFGGFEHSQKRMLHFAPEPFFSPMFSWMFANYETADISMPGVDHSVDLQKLPFADASYDVVYASHVLEHVPDDHAAISEIRRILSPGGIAVLPVPIVSPHTIEYPEPNPHETMHVRAPGPDYFNRYALAFARVDVVGSSSFPEKYQVYSYGDMSDVPNSRSPLRIAMEGHRHEDFVPICHV